MHIGSVYLRRFRGLERASLPSCAALNVLIGRNNSGKSSILAAIELALERLQKGRAASVWRQVRPNDAFTGRKTERPLQIGLTFDVKQATIQAFQGKLLSESPGLDVAIDQLKATTNISVIFAADIMEDDAVIYIKELGAGQIDDSGDDLTLAGTRFITIPPLVAQELGRRENKTRAIEADLRTVEQIREDVIEYAVRQKGEKGRWRNFIREPMHSRRVTSLIDELFLQSSNREEVEAGRAVIKEDLLKEIQDLEDAEVSSPITTFSGTSKRVPHYVSWLMRNLAEGRVVSFKEVRKSVGREEASQLLDLKLRRGGTQSLARIQDTVKSLLGVDVDAFQADESIAVRYGRSSGNAEMDIDNFLVEANGAGIREALRIILDLELGSPVFATVEEPEVHLHPGLERVVHRYLVDKSKSMQLFVATHSSNFLDTTTRQNVYLVSREKGLSAKVEKVASENDLLLISQEIGLRPSTVLMFDRLIFVEGPSDEGILSEIAKHLNLDLASESATFVQMAGSTGFNHYSADATIDLLSRRQIKMWFIIDNDERSEADVNRMVERLGDRATLIVLKRRELENYILYASAIAKLIVEKSATTQRKIDFVDLVAIEKAITESAQALLERAIELQVEKRLLKPLYAKHGGATVEEKLSGMKNALDGRLKLAHDVQEEVRNSLAGVWDREARNLAPGSEILDAVLSPYGLRYSKLKDGPRLAREVNASKIDQELICALQEMMGPAIQYDQN